MFRSQDEDKFELHQGFETNRKTTGANCQIIRKRANMKERTWTPTTILTSEVDSVQRCHGKLASGYKADANFSNSVL